MLGQHALSFAFETVVHVTRKGGIIVHILFPFPYFLNYKTLSIFHFCIDNHILKVHSMSLGGFAFHK